MEFMQTPMRSQDQNDTSNDYQSQQKQKYESNRHNLSIISNNQGPNINLDSTAHTDGQDLYDGQIPVQIKSFEREEWQTFLNFKIQLPQKGQSGGLYLELTDESNPQFLYILNLGEQQFISLKNEQNLLIDFHTFPKQITELIDLTLSTSNKEDKLHFQSVLEIKNSGEANLNILEFNKFKSLIHLSLNFRKATDEFLKKFLSQKLNKEKSENQELRIKTQRQEELIHDKNNQMQQLSNQLQKFQEEKERILEQLALEEQKKISELREGILKREEGLKKETQFQTNQITEKYETQITNLQEKVKNNLEAIYSLQKSINFLNNYKVNQLSLKNSDLTEAKMTLEVNERDMKNKIKIQERELQLLNKEVENLRIDNKEQEQIRFRQEKKITELTVQISSLEQQLKDKISQIQDNKELVNNSKSQKEIMQQSIDSYKKQVDKLEKKIELCSEQINKGNDIIEKLQSEIQKSKQKIKMKNQLALEQEKSINNYQEQIDKLQKENNEVIRNKDTTSLTNQKLESENKDLKQKIEESMRMIEQNKSIIQYLNQQLNEKSGPKSSFGMTNNNLSTISSKYGGMLENQYRLSNYQTESNFQNQNKLSSGTNYLGSTNNMNCSANTGKQNHLKEFDMNAQQQHYNNHSPYSNKSTFVSKSPIISKSQISSINKNINNELKENIDYSSGGDLSKYLSQGGKNIYNQIKGETSYSTANNSMLNNNNNNTNNCQYNDEEDEDFNQRVAPIKFQKPIK